jgi:hypothetical protein
MINLRGVGPVPGSVVLALVLGQVFVLGYRFWRIRRASQIHTRPRNALHIVYIGLFFN